MKHYQLVEYIMIAFLIAYVILEVVLNTNDVEDDTSDIIIRKWSEGKFFFIPFALGAICGHLFLGTSDPTFQTHPLLPVAILFGLCLIMLGIGIRIKFQKTVNFLMTLLLLGVVYGHLFWSMNHLKCYGC